MTSLTAEQKRLFFSLTEDQRKELERTSSLINEIEAKFNEAYNKCQALSKQYEALTGLSLLRLMAGESGRSAATSGGVSGGGGKRMKYEEYVRGLKDAVIRDEPFTIPELMERLEVKGLHPSRSTLAQSVIGRLIEEGLVEETGENRGRAKLYRRR